MLSAHTAGRQQKMTRPEATTASMLPRPQACCHVAEQSREQQSRDRVTAEQSRVTHTRAEQGDTHVRDSSRAEQRAAEQSRVTHTSDRSGLPLLAVQEDE